MQCTGRSLAGEKIRHLQIGRDPDAFRFHELLDRFDATLAADAALLDAAKRRGVAAGTIVIDPPCSGFQPFGHRSEEPTSELQTIMRISYAVFCLKKKNNH